MPQLSAPLVGMRFRPPALTILQGLGMDQPLELRREPDNAYDACAIQVWVPQDWTDDKLELAGEAKEEANSIGKSDIAEDIDKGRPVFLGFIAAYVAKEWAPVFDQAISEGTPLPPARLTFSPTGSPQVTLEIADKSGEQQEGSSDTEEPA